MQMLTQADCLALWEAGRSLHPIDQGLLAVHAAFPETRAERVADWPLGRRNRALAQARRATFGPMLRGWTRCRECGGDLEFEMDSDALLESHSDDPAAAVSALGRSFRLPTSRDLAAIATELDPTAAAVLLAERCAVDISEAAPAGWTEAELDELGNQMESADPLAEILMSFQCPVCGALFQEEVDLAKFLWTEMEALARRLLGQVHRLASAYGWSEKEILSLSEARRGVYLEMVNA